MGLGHVVSLCSGFFWERPEVQLGAGNLDVSVRRPHRGMGRADGCVSLGLQAEA